MDELIKIRQHEGNSVISARDLHSYLDSKTKFAQWIKRMFEYGFASGTDFIPLLGKSSGGRPEDDFALTIDCAKEIAMLQRSEKGKQARQYFIECEKKMKQVQVLSPAEMLLQQAQMMVEQERRVNIVEKRLDLIEAKTATRPDYFTVMGYAVYSGIKIGIDKAKVIGQRAYHLCKKKGYPIDKIPDPRFGTVGSYPKDVLDEIFASPM